MSQSVRNVTVHHGVQQVYGWTVLYGQVGIGQPFTYGLTITDRYGRCTTTSEPVPVGTPRGVAVAGPMGLSRGLVRFSHI